jgi:hypothetical protein
LSDNDAFADDVARQNHELVAADAEKAKSAAAGVSSRRSAFWTAFIFLALLFLVGLGVLTSGDATSSSCGTTQGSTTGSAVSVVHGVPIVGAVLDEVLGVGAPARHRASCVSTLTGDGTTNAPHYQRITPTGGSDSSASGTGSSNDFDAAANGLSPGQGEGTQVNTLGPQAPASPSHPQTSSTPHVDSTQPAPGPQIVIVPPSEPPPPADPCAGQYNDPSSPCYSPGGDVLPPDTTPCPTSIGGSEVATPPDEHSTDIHSTSGCM